MTEIDLVAIGIILISVLLSLQRGLIAEVLSLSSCIIAFWFSKELAPFFASQLFSGEQDSSIPMLTGYILTFVSIWGLTIGLRLLLNTLVGLTGLGMVNRGLGAAFGFLRGSLIVTILTLIAGFTGYPQTDIWRQSLLTTPFERIVLSLSPWMPSALLNQLHFSDSDSGAPILRKPENHPGQL